MHLIFIHEVIPEEPLELLLSNFSKVERKFPKGMVIAYAAPSPLALIPLAGKAAKEMAQVLNIAPIEVGAATAPLTQDDLEQAAPDTEVQPRGPKAEHEVGPVTTQRAPAPPDGAGPVLAPSGAPLPTDWKDLVDLSHITDEKLKAPILNMLAPHKDMWSDEFGKIRATEHNIDLKPDTRPLHQHLYRAGPE